MAKIKDSGKTTGKGRGKQSGALRWGQKSLLASGKWRAAYIGPDRKRYTSPYGSYATKSAAQAWLDSEEELIDRKMWTPPDIRKAAEDTKMGETVAAFAKGWLAQANLRPSTLKDYRQALNLRILPTLGDVALVHLDRAMVRRWWRGLDVEENPRACDKAYAALRAMLNVAIDEEIIDVNPCRVKGAGKKSKERTRVPLTPAQVWVVADAMPPQLRLGVLLGAWCALREGEVLDLRWSDFDLNPDKPGVVITHAVSEVAGSGMVSAAPKTEAGERFVPIPGAILPDVRSHLTEYCGDEPNPMLFRRKDGQHVAFSTFRRAFYAALEKTGLPSGRAGYVFHDLRHIGLTYLGGAGVTPKEKRSIAGHTTEAMTSRYEWILDEHLTDVMERYSATIEAGRPNPV